MYVKQECQGPESARFQSGCSMFCSRSLVFLIQKQFSLTIMCEIKFISPEAVKLII